MRAREPACDPLSASPGQRGFEHWAGLDPHRSDEIQHKDPSVPSAVGLCAARNGVDHAVCQAILDDDFDLYLGHKDGDERGAVVPFLPPLLVSESFDFRDRHPFHTYFHQCRRDVIQLERLHDGFNDLHLDTPYELGAPEDADRAASWDAG